MNTPITGGASEGKAFSVLHKVFFIGLILKGLNALFELIGGTALLFVSTATIQGWINQFFGPVLGKNPESVFGHIALGFASRITPGGQAFVAWYFLSHGVIKLGIVLCLVRGWLWAYPAAIFVFVGFMVFQTWELVFGNHSLVYLGLDIFDGFIIWLTINEWRHARHHRHPTGANGPAGPISAG